MAWQSEIMPRGTQISWLGTIFHNFLLNVNFLLKNPSHSSQKPTGLCRYCHAVVLSWAIKHFDFHKLAALWLARLISNHVRIYGSNVAKGFSVFQRRCCVIWQIFAREFTFLYICIRGRSILGVLLLLLFIRPIQMISFMYHSMCHMFWPMVL